MSMKNSVDPDQLATSEAYMYIQKHCEKAMYIVHILLLSFVLWKVLSLNLLQVKF